MSKKIKVNSSNLEFVEYIADRKELRIWFLSEKNIVYAYADVTEKVYDELIKASSVGGFFTEYIKYKYQFKKIEEGHIKVPKTPSKNITLYDSDIKQLRAVGRITSEDLGYPLEIIYKEDDSEDSAVGLNLVEVKD